MPDRSRCPSCGERASPYAAGCAVCGADLDPSRWDKGPSLENRIGSIVMSVENLPAMVEFWCAALDYEPREPPTETHAMLCPRTGNGPNLALERRPSATSEPPRFHLDLYAQDQRREVERLIALGATRMQERNRPADADYVMLRDPDGNRFCVVDAGGR